MRKEYNLNVNDFNDTGVLTRPADGSSVALDKVSIQKNGEYVAVHSYDYAGHLLGAAICSCGKQIDSKRFCMLLMDGSVFYPALCCGKAIFYEGVVKI